MHARPLRSVIIMKWETYNTVYYKVGEYAWNMWRKNELSTVERKR